LAPDTIFSSECSLAVFKYGSVRSSERNCTWPSSAENVSLKSLLNKCYNVAKY
jgi:hypothetical protein